jgi:hypothetical protein
MDDTNPPGKAANHVRNRAPDRMTAFHVGTVGKRALDVRDVLGNHPGKIGWQCARLTGAEHLPRRVIIPKRLVCNVGGLPGGLPQRLGKPLSPSSARGENEERSIHCFHIESKGPKAGQYAKSD